MPRQRDAASWYAAAGMPLVLLAEDELVIADAVQYALRSEGMATEHVLLAGAVAPRVRRGDVDLVLLDIGLPDGSGLDVCRELRTFTQVPVIFLTARHEVVDRVVGLELGADDYLGKPFSVHELVARVRARLRRRAAAAPTEPGWTTRGAFAIDHEGHRIQFRGQLLELTRYEHALLAALLRRPGAILSRAQLMERGWDSDADSADRTVDTHIKTLRAKLRAAGAVKDPIRTYRGLGYALEP
jgi:two-component system, OmpR family, catabolic regulation response regulator CreB